MDQQKQPPQENAIDWNEMAEAFDRWLPYIQPVAEALVDLADVGEGHQILDVASGTGEPSLTLARRCTSLGISITGIDGAEAMVARANQKAKTEGLSFLHFKQMNAEALQFEKAHFDRVISRFGLMLFDDPAKGLEEMRRVLRHGGKIALAVWGEFHEISSLCTIWDRVMAATPEDKRPTMPRIGRLGRDGALESLMEEAGFNPDALEVTPFILPYHYDSFEAYWEICTSAGMLKDPIEALSNPVREKVKSEVEDDVRGFWKDGQLVFQNKALLAFAVK